MKQWSNGWQTGLKALGPRLNTSFEHHLVIALDYDFEAKIKKVHP